MKVKVFSFITLLGLIAFFSGCSDEDQNDTPEPEVHIPEIFNYSAYAFGSSDTQQIVLDSLTADIVGIESNSSWLSVSESQRTAEGSPVIIINAQGGDAPDSAIVTVSTSNGDKALITVKHIDLTRVSGGASPDDFLKNWWKCEKVELQGMSAAQRTPWTIEGGVTIPTEIRKQYSPSQGWEMAFCYLNDDSMEGVRFFALYELEMTFVCVREKGNGVKPLYVAITPKEYYPYRGSDPVANGLCRSKYCPAETKAVMISKLFQDDWEFYKACFDEADVGKLTESDFYWYDDSHDYIVYMTWCCINLRSGELDDFDLNFHSPEKHILLKIDWEDD